MKVRAKFVVQKSAHMGYAGPNNKSHLSMCYKNGEETKVPFREISMSAICGTDGENKSFSEATPSGTIVFSLNNPDLKDEFEPGSTYYVTFEKAE